MPRDFGDFKEYICSFVGENSERLKQISRLSSLVRNFRMAKFSRGRLWFAMVGSLAIFVAIIAPGADAWGKEGHFATCRIAEALLSEEAADAVQKLLPRRAEGDLASLCSWPDQIRFRYHWSSPLHFIDTPDDACNYDYSRDCHNPHGEEGMCLEGAINNYTAQLATYGDTSSNENHNLTEALLFLSHFMGDIHQPLHVGFTEDRGGNSIEVRWYRRKTNLHHIWDGMIIETALKDFYDSDLTVFIEDIQKNITDSWSKDVHEWEKCNRNKLACPNLYAQESISLACNWAYKNVSPGDVLDDDYFLTRLPIIEKQLAKGGVRLAAALNRIFDPVVSERRDSEL